MKSFTVVDAVVMVVLKATLIFQSKYAKDSKAKRIRRSTEEHLRHFSHQIDIVQETCMEIPIDGYLRTLNRWVKEAVYLKSKVRYALEEHEKSEDPSLNDKNLELERLCNEIFDYMKECPVEDVNDNPLAFVSWMHEKTVNYSLSLSQDVEKQVDSSESSSSIKTQTTKSYSVHTPTLQNKGAENEEDESSHSYHTPSNVQDDEEVDAGFEFPILVTGEISKYMDLKLKMLSMSSSEVTSNLNGYFGLSPEKDLYLFSNKKMAERKGVLLPEYLLVNRSISSKSKEMPTANEWHQACVVNLTDKIFLLPSEEPDCPNLVLLFLQRNGGLIDIPSNFFKKMPALRFLDLSDTRIQTLPRSLFELTQLQVLLLRSCARLDRLPADVQKLVNMEVLDLFGTYLEFPEEIGELAKLTHLQLSFSRTKFVKSGALSKLKALQALSIEVDPKDHYYWSSTVGDMIKKVGELKKLNYLRFYLPTVKDLESLTDVTLWKEKRLQRFNFIVGRNINRIISRVPDTVQSIYEKHDRCLRFINGGEVPQVMKSVLMSVTAFYLDHHSEIWSLSELDIYNFEEVEFCVLRECRSMHVMMEEDERETQSVFPKLKRLELHYLWKLQRIWEDRRLPRGSFKALKYMRVSTCGELVYIASYSILQCLSQLETFIIEDCESLESIVKKDETVKSEPTLLLKLKKLQLLHLPKLDALGSGLSPGEEVMDIHFCPKLASVPKKR